MSERLPAPSVPALLPAVNVPRREAAMSDTPDVLAAIELLDPENGDTQ